MAGKVTTKRTDKGKKALLAEYKRIGSKPYVKIGILGSDALKTKTVSKIIEGKKVEVSEPLLDVVDVAVFNEFGGGGTPERSFVRSTAKQKRKEWRRLQDTLIKNWYRQKQFVTPGGAIKILKAIGLQGSSDIVEKITSLRTPPNSPETIARKKSSNPLVDTRQLAQSVTFKVEGARK